MKPELRKVAMEMLFQLYTKISNYIYDTVFQRAILEFAPLYYSAYVFIGRLVQQALCNG